MKGKNKNIIAFLDTGVFIEESKRVSPNKSIEEIYFIKALQALANDNGSYICVIDEVKKEIDSDNKKKQQTIEAIKLLEQINYNSPQWTLWESLYNDINNTLKNIDGNKGIYETQRLLISEFQKNRNKYNLYLQRILTFGIQFLLSQQFIPNSYKDLISSASHFKADVMLIANVLLLKHLLNLDHNIIVVSSEAFGLRHKNNKNVLDATKNIICEYIHEIIGMIRKHNIKELRAFTESIKTKVGREKLYNNKLHLADACYIFGINYMSPAEFVSYYYQKT